MNTKIYIGCMALCMALSGATASAQALTGDSLINVAFGQVAKEDLIHAVSSVNKNKLSHETADNGSLSLLSSFVGGYTGNVWGQSPLIMIDGVPRDASMVNASEIESISVLKGAAAVTLYGSAGSRGVVLITTKRGMESPLTIDVRGTVGFAIPKRYPNYLNAASYMSFYNEACANDGINALYSQDAIYQSTQGTNPYRYPDMNFYSDEYLRDFATSADGIVEIYGGNNSTRYYVNLGVDYGQDIVKVGEHKDSHDLNFNVRGNVDMKISNHLKATTNASFLVLDNFSGRGNFWGDANSLRPNWFAPLLPISMMDPNNSKIQDYIATSNHLIDGKYLLGGTTSNQTNAISEALAAGYTRQKYRKFLFDVALDADLSGVTPGLSFRADYSVDYNAHYSEAYAQTYAVYQPTWGSINGQDMIIDLEKINEDKSSTSEYVGQSTYYQTMMASVQFDYARTFNAAHNVGATLVGWGFQKQLSADSGHSGEGSYHRTSNLNLGLRATYNYMHRYYVDLTGALVHSSRLPEGKRNAFSPSVTLGWRLSQEAFLQDVDWLNELKLSASYANLHQDLDISDFYMYKGDYQFSPSSGWYQWKDGTVGGSTSTSKRGENDQLSFITNREYRVSLGAQLLNDFSMTVDYFHQKTSGLLTQGASTIYPSFYNSGLGNFLPYINYNEDIRNGFDFELGYNHRFGQVDVNLGFVGMYFHSKAAKRDEVWQEDYLYREGHALDASWGYICDGFFQSEAEIASSPKQQFGGTVRPGDLKYRDMNGDGVINTLDQVDLAKMGWGASPFTYGLNLSVKWNNFTLFAAGSGRSGSYFYRTADYMRGTSKFTDVVLDRWTEATAATAKYPRLTTTNGDNNYQNSTFWLAKNDCFTLDNLQLTYDLPQSVFSRCFINGLSVYGGAYSLFMISKERKYLETNYGSSPQCRTLYLGFKLKI